MKYWKWQIRVVKLAILNSLQLATHFNSYFTCIFIIMSRLHLWTKETLITKSPISPLDQYMAPNSKYTGVECTPPPPQSMYVTAPPSLLPTNQMEVSAPISMIYEDSMYKANFTLTSERIRVSPPHPRSIENECPTPWSRTTPPSPHKKGLVRLYSSYYLSQVLKKIVTKFNSSIYGINLFKLSKYWWIHYNTPMWHFGPCVTFWPCQCHFWTCQCDFSALRLFPASGTLPRELKKYIEIE